MTNLANSSPVAVLCFLAPDGSAQVDDIASRVVGLGKAWILAALYDEHHPVFGACITHGQISERQLYDLIEALEVAERPSA